MSMKDTYFWLFGSLWSVIIMWLSQKKERIPLGFPRIGIKIYCGVYWGPFFIEPPIWCAHGGN